MTEQRIRVNVPAPYVPDVENFLSLLGFVPQEGVQPALDESTVYVCNGQQLHLADAEPSDLATAPVVITLPVRDPPEVAASCWNDGYTVEAEEQPGEDVRLTLVGPCGLRVTLECVDR